MRPFKELQKDPDRPASLDPGQYAFVGAADMHPGRSWVEVRHDLLARFGVETGSSDRHSTVNVPFYDIEPDGRWLARCHFCGSTREGGLKSNIFYFCFFLHKPSKVAVCVGQDCARKYNLGTKSEREFQHRRDEYFRQLENEEVHTFLRRWAEWHERGGKFYDFLGSLWKQFQERNWLTDKQMNAVRDRWMDKPQPWMEGPERQLQDIEPTDADRHKGEVTHPDEPPTDAQMEYISKLVDELKLEYQEIANIYPKTRGEARDAINTLKAQVLKQRYREERQEENDKPATSRQLSFINDLMDSRSMSLEARREARQRLDSGISRSIASQWIDKLKTLPMIDKD